MNKIPIFAFYFFILIIFDMKSFIFSKTLIILLLVHSTLLSHADIWQVGPNKPYSKPSEVAQLVNDGDTVEIDAGLYVGDVAGWTANNLLIRGINGIVHLKAEGAAYGGKAIWVIAGNNTTIEYIEFSECSVPDENGAGIRQEGRNLTVRHCYFHNNENGILAGTVNPSTILIEYCEFNNNGFGDGYTHNIYINHVDTLIFRYNYVHHAKIGHEIKSRAHVNIIEYNRISNESGTASRCIDLPNGGISFLIGNIIEQGPNAPNSNIIGYGLETLSNTPPHALYLINNTIINNRSYGRFLHFGSGSALLKAYNNIFAGNGILSDSDFLPPSLDTASNYITTDLSGLFFTNAGQYNFELTAHSTVLINSGSNPGIAHGRQLTPEKVYKHPSNNEDRCLDTQIDIGAFEYCTNNNIMTHDKLFIHLYPNPTSDFIELELIDYAYIRLKIDILDINGRIIFQDIIEQSETYLLDMRSYKPGIYFLKISDDTFSKIHKIVKH